MSVHVCNLPSEIVLISSQLYTPSQRKVSVPIYLLYNEQYYIRLLM